MMEDRETTEAAQGDRRFEDASPGARAGGFADARREPRHPGNLMKWLLLAIMLVLVLVYTYLKDAPPPWEEGLRREPFTETTPDLSAPARMKVLLTAAAKFDGSKMPVQPAWLWETPVLARTLEEQGAVLDNVRDLLEEKEQEWQPRSSLWMIEDFGDDRAWQKIMVLKQAEAAYLARRGQEEQAFLAAMDLVVLAHLLERIDAWPSLTDRALEMQERSAQSLAELLKRTQLSADVLARLQEEEYRPWAPSLDALRNAMRGYYAYERKLLLGPENWEPPLPPGYVPARSGWLFFKPYATLQLFVDSFRELQSESAFTAFARQNQIEQRVQRLRSGRGWLPTANGAGEDYFATRIQPYAAFFDRHAVARAQHAAVMTLFALRRYVAVESHIPRTAADLTPKYLPTPALDPFSGEPMRFNIIRGLIYSVGTDLKDEGGKPTSPPLGDPTEPTVETGIGVATSTGE